MQQELFLQPKFDDTLWAVLPMQHYRGDWTPPPFANLANQRTWGGSDWSEVGSEADQDRQEIKAITEQGAEDLLAVNQHFQAMYRPVRANPFIFDRHFKSNDPTILYSKTSLILDEVTTSVYHELPHTNKLKRMAYDLKYGNVYLSQPPVTKISVEPSGKVIRRPFGVKLMDLVDFLVNEDVERKYAEYISERDDPLFGSNPPRYTKFDNPYHQARKAPLGALRITFLSFKFGLNPPENTYDQTYPYIKEWKITVPNEKEWRQLAGTEFLPNA